MKIDTLKIIFLIWKMCYKGVFVFVCMLFMRIDTFKRLFFEYEKGAIGCFRVCMYAFLNAIINLIVFLVWKGVIECFEGQVKMWEVCGYAFLT